MIETTYTLAEEEYCEAQMAVMRFRQADKFKIRRIQIAVFATLAVALPGLPFYFWFRFGDQLSFPPMMLLIELWLIWLLYNLITLRAAKKQLKKLYKQALEGQTSVELRIDESGWRDHTPGISTTFVEWVAFSHWMETGAMFMVLRRTRQFHMIPKRVLTSEKLNQLRELVNSHVPEAMADRRGRGLDSRRA